MGLPPCACSSKDGKLRRHSQQNPSWGLKYHTTLWLIDNANLEELAAACAERNRYEFMLTLAPLRLRNVTGSPVNPIAMF